MMNSTNLPRINCFTIAIFFTRNSDFFSVEFRNVKTFIFVNECRKTVAEVDLRNVFHNVSILQEHNNFDLLTRGLTTEPSYASDRFHEKDITNFLFRGERPLGNDLKSLDIQRSRDHGIATYNDYRVLCNLKRAKKFSDFSDVMKLKYVKILGKIYEHPDDVDFIVGGSLEILLPGGLVGHTFTCIFVKQFKNMRSGDRLFYDHKEGPFTLEQLTEIRKSTISRWYCDNTKYITRMQPNGFLSLSPNNKLVNCSSLPKVNLMKWKD